MSVVRIEAVIVQRLANHFARLAEAGRCVFAQEVRVLTWGHIAKGAQRIRADFVVQFDGQPALCAIEVKGRLEQPSDLGRALSQCDDYARANVGVNDARAVPQDWVGQPIWGAFLAFDVKGSAPPVQEHEPAAHRIFGPRRVGFVEHEPRGLCLRLGGERWWTEWNGWRADAFVRGVRIGSSKTEMPQ